MDTTMVQTLITYLERNIPLTKDDIDITRSDFLETYPSIAQQLPRHMLASYPGITPETLSRIHRKSMRKK